MRTDETAFFQEHVEILRSTLIRVFVIIAIGTAVSFFFYGPIISLLTRPLFHSKASQSVPLLIEKPLEHVYVKNRDEKAIIYQLPDSLVNIVQMDPNVKEVGPYSLSIPPGETIVFSKSIKASQLYIMGPLEGMMIALKTSLWVGVLITSPLWMIVILQFIVPALHQHEKRLLFPFMIISFALMIAGGVFAYAVTIPLANGYLSAFNQAIGDNLWSLEHYLNYTFFLLFANSLAFESCVIGIFAVQLGIITGEALRSHRRLAIVLAFVAGALLTPPDIFTQFMLAIPLIILYEIVILYAHFKRV